MLRYRVVVEHPDGPLLGELKMKNQRLQELKAAKTGPTRSMGSAWEADRPRHTMKSRQLTKVYTCRIIWSDLWFAYRMLSMVVFRL